MERFQVALCVALTNAASPRIKVSFFAGASFAGMKSFLFRSQGANIHLPQMRLNEKFANY